MNSKNLVVVLVAIFILVFHNDFWWWDSIDPMLFGWMPIGLWYQVLYHLLTAAGLYLIVRFAWGEPSPEFYEDLDNGQQNQQKEGGK